MATIQIDRLLETCIKRGASDLHITVGRPPSLRLHGRLRPLETKTLEPEDTAALMKAITPERCQQELSEVGSTDFGFEYGAAGRFRTSVFHQKGNIAMVLRLIPSRIFTFDEIGLPRIVRSLCRRPRGMFLVTGPTGSGKTTTLATMLDYINKNFDRHIITIEDPIEYIHPHKKCLVNQREVGADTSSFKKALKYILRQDPDVVLLGELRDLETIEAALTIAETGHLCFATLHTNGCVQTINRIIDVFPTNQQTQVRTQLSFVLEGVLSQTLIPRMSGKGRILSLEVMVPNMAIRALIRDDKVHQIYSQMQMGQEKYGMQTMNQSLFMLYHKKLITMEDALSRSSDIDELKQMIANPAAVLRRQVSSSNPRV
ncbi:MAG TPA: type IV pilus twitching motility protein PilT [Desulfuromonadales bacterium]|nr:type IV pilus twitching motility protein PilT [Desulfuromonadales bacterium]